jgi:glutamate/tyrosine decarboxylase-like PLP-dependent enzyme
MAAPLFTYVRKLAPARRRLEQEYAHLLQGLEPALKPYRSTWPTFAQLPPQGLPRAEVLRQIEAMAEAERPRWQSGFASGAVYHGDREHIDFLNQVYARTSQCNPLHADLWPSTSKYEAEVVAMTAAMLGATPGDAEICGTVTSGGTESILLAMKAYRDRAKRRRPQMVVPITAHAAFDKAAQYFNLELARVPVDDGGRADLGAVRAAINRRTVVVVGSAPCFPYGVIDPIAEMAALAAAAGVGFHTDACLGGFVLPWARKLGYPVPAFDFQVPGVTSISVDTHKYGYAAKGTSVVLYRGRELRRHQYFVATDWPGGLYFSPTLAGSRPGGLSAACWATLLTMGEEGYLEATRQILTTAERLRRGIAATAGLRVIGEPLWNIAFASEELDVYRVLEQLSARGWSLNGLHMPPAVHLCVTLRHTQAGVAERFLADLAAAVEHVRVHPHEHGSMAPVYGMAATLPFRGAVADLLERYVDLLYQP